MARLSSRFLTLSCLLLASLGGCSGEALVTGTFACVTDEDCPISYGCGELNICVLCYHAPCVCIPGEAEPCWEQDDPCKTKECYCNEWGNWVPSGFFNLAPDGTLCGEGICQGGSCVGPECFIISVIPGAGTYVANSSYLDNYHYGSCGGVLGRDAVFEIHLAEASSLHLDTKGSDFDTVLYVRGGDCEAPEAELVGACNDDVSINSDRTSSLGMWLPAGTYYVFVDGYNNMEGGHVVLNVCIGQQGESACDDGEDNDCDGLADCEDADCEGRSCGDGLVCLRGFCQPPPPEGYEFIPPGTFTMGSPPDEPGRGSDEGPQHEVTITRGFYLKATEVTQGEWEDLMESNPSYFDGCDDCPVEMVNWWESLAYCNALSDRGEVEECYGLTGCVGAPGEDLECTGVTFLGLGCEGYRLPTEAEWEYAVRAGTTTAFYTGGITETGCGLDPSLDRAGWYCGNEGYVPHPVAQKEPNGWGLYDMHGNVWEWVWDWYDAGYYVSSLSEDPMGPEGGSARITRGGGWGYIAKHCRSAYRYLYSPGIRSNYLGFRPSRTLP